MTFLKVGLLGLGLLAGCTRPNPLACSDGSCTDNAFPFCDVDGALGGTPAACIAVACTPGEFAACRDDNAITCNAGGNNYDLIHCDLGCDMASGGCRACNPGTTACANGAVSTCDAAGNVTAQTACPLGCFESEPRCRDIDPSNGLAMYLDMVPSPPDLDLTDAVFDTMTGDVTDGGNPVTVPSFAIAAPAGGVPIRVFIVNTLKLKNATLQSSVGNGNGPAFALVARGDITISGVVFARLIGEVTTTTCVGGQGAVEALSPGDGTMVEASGGGGGGNATVGAKGGDMTQGIGGGIVEHGGPAGVAAGTANLVPLRGGCAGGGDSDSSGPFPPNTLGGGGGGAVQFSSASAIVVNGTIDVRGGVGFARDFGQGGFAVTGGGAGGGLLLEAPQVTLGASAELLATGGGGGIACATPTSFCGAGGDGATPGLPATAGSVAAEADPGSAGGGGGGLGRIRVNTPDQTYVTSNTSVQDGATSVGTLSTR